MQPILKININGEFKDFSKLSSLTKFYHSRNELTFTLLVEEEKYVFSKNTLSDFLVGINGTAEYSLIREMTDSEPYDSALGFLVRAFAPILWRCYLFYRPVLPVLYEITTYVEQITTNNGMDFEKPVFLFTYPDGEQRTFDLNNFANYVTLTEEIFYSVMPGDYKMLEKNFQKLQIKGDRFVKYPPYITYAASVLAYLGYLLYVDNQDPVLPLTREQMSAKPFRKVLIHRGNFIL